MKYIITKIITISKSNSVFETIMLLSPNEFRNNSKLVFNIISRSGRERSTRKRATLCPSVNKALINHDGIKL